MNNRDWSKIRLIQAIILISMIVSVTAFAAPEWRDLPGTTFQEWSFSTSDSEDIQPDADTLNNPYGSPFVWVGDRAIWDDAGAWALVTDEMDIFIPNNLELKARKEMQIEIVWSPGEEGEGGFLPKRPLVSVYPEYGDGRVVSPDITILDPGSSIPGSFLFRTVIGVNIQPNPESEWIILKGDIVVDHIAVDTYCVPEPATFGLLIGGAFMAIRRKAQGLR